MQQVGVVGSGAHFGSARGGLTRQLPMVATHTMVRQQEEWTPVAAHVAVMMTEAQRPRRH